MLIFRAESKESVIYIHIYIYILVSTLPKLLCKNLETLYRIRNKYQNLNVRMIRKLEIASFQILLFV